MLLTIGLKGSFVKYELGKHGDVVFALVVVSVLQRKGICDHRPVESPSAWSVFSNVSTCYTRNKELLQNRVFPSSKFIGAPR